MAIVKKEQEVFEDDPGRIDGMLAAVRAVDNIKGGQDFLSEEERLRELAEDLRLPYLSLYLVVNEDMTVGLKEAEVREWSAWSTEVERKRARRATILPLVEGD